MTAQQAKTSSIHSHWTYDVFLNFRGEDTRHGFTGHLYDALNKMGICTFFDDKEIRIGDEITPTLLKAIQESRMAITVFSEEYASSTFCLDELVQIHQCINGNGRLVWPIFYNVEPSEVRHQRGKYGQALVTHEQNSRADEEKIKKWKHTLREVANLKGSPCDTRKDYEGEIIKEIVNHVVRIIKEREPLDVAEYPVGLTSRIAKINSLLQLGSNDKVFMVGICGTGGMGKTTIARALYNVIADHFDYLCFLGDIKGESAKHGLQQQQAKMLSKLLRQKIEIEDIDEGVGLMKRTLKGKKTLLILDNVDERKQLQKLAGTCEWFGSGSRIIITTRDLHLLKFYGVERIYDMEGLNHKECLELLSWMAFRKKQVDDPRYKDVVEHVIRYARGLPLALELIGSELYGKNVTVWESMLNGRKRTPHDKIQQILKVSYDGLQQPEKEVFLDIACFYNGCELKYVKKMLGIVHDYDPADYPIGVLVDKCLIKIEKRSGMQEDDCINMHDLVQDMGREIVHQESRKDPRKRSRLWSSKDIRHVLEESEGTSEVIAIIQVEKFKCIEIVWDGKAFESMKNLKILILENAKFSKDPEDLPNSLAVLRWRGYPSSSLPDGFRPKNLVEFDVRDSNFKSTMEAVNKMILQKANVSVLNFSWCKYIEKMPNLSGLPCLKELWLSYCKNLIEIDNSVGQLPKLETLDVSGCTELRTLPSELNTPSLVHLDLSYCKNMNFFPEMVTREMKISVLNLSWCKSIEKIPNLSGLRSLMWLLLKDCTNLIEIDNSVGQLPKLETLDVSGCTKLRTLPSELNTPSLVHLDLSYCNNLNFFPEIVIREMKISILNLLGCKSIEKVPNLSGLPSLKKLQLKDCTNLVEIDNSVGQLSKLETLDVSGCTKLRTLPSELNTPSLVHLDLSYCRNLNVFPEIVTREMKISVLNLLGCKSIKKVPNLSSLPSLKKLQLKDCTNLIEIDNSVGQLPKLEVLDVSGCTKLRTLPSELNTPSLVRLDLSYCRNLNFFPEIVTREMKISVLNLLGCKSIEKVPNLSGLPSLKKLQLKDCTNLIEVDNSVGQLPKLETLDVSGCTKLRTLPSGLNTPSLVHLDLSYCRNLNLFPEMVTREMKLSVLNLLGCKSIEKIPNLFGLPSLKKLLLRDCTNLIEIDNSVGQLPKLETLDVSGCTKVRTLPSELNTPSLVDLDLRYCKSIEKIPNLSGLLSLKKLQLKDCTNLIEIDNPIGQLPKLETLDVSGCTKLRTLPSELNTPSLVDLDLRCCRNLNFFPKIIAREMKIFVLNLSWCKSIEKIPNLSGLLSLMQLLLRDCTNLIEIDNSIGQLPKLEILDVSGCTKLRTLPSELNTPSLVHLGLGSCRNLNYFPEIVTREMKISVLNLSWFKFIEKIPNLSSLTSLKKLQLKYCKNLIEIDNSVGQLPKLETLDVRGCIKLRTFPSELNTPSLVHLDLSYCKNLNFFPEIVTREMKISSLSLKGTGIDQLPPSVENLSRICTVEIRTNSRVRSMKLPSSTFLSPKLESIKVEGFKEELIMEVESIKSIIKIGYLEIRFCNISNENLRICLAVFCNVHALNLTGSDFTILPACIENCRVLEVLVLDACKHLIGVEKVPPRIMKLTAGDCTSLSSESRKLILSKELLAFVALNNIEFTLERPHYCVPRGSVAKRFNHRSKGQRPHFCVPRGSVPEWFDHCSKGPSISFWFLDHFPTHLILCVIVEAKGDYVKVKRKLFINEKAYIDQNTSVSIGYDEDHIIVDYIFEFDINQLFAQGQWKHAKICLCPSKGDAIKEIGIYVARDNKTNMENIQFVDPFQCSDLLTNDQGCTVEGDTTATNDPFVPSQSEKQHTHSHVVPDIEELGQLFEACRRLTFPISIHMDPGIVGSKLEYNIIITKQDVMEFLSMQDMCITIIQCFVMFAYDLCCYREIDDRFGFLCPNAVQSIGNTREDRISYIGSTIKEGNKQCWLVPICEEKHWSLCAICPESNIIYWFDSLGREQSDDIEKIFTEALDRCHIIGEKNTKWLRPNCHRQLGDKECGYYVIRYMYDIINLNQVHLLDTHFKNLECYTQEEINFIREMWSVVRLFPLF